MSDRTTKALLATAIVLLLALLVHPALVPPDVRAQAQAAPPAGQPAMAASNYLVYTLQDNQLSVFYVDFGIANPFEILKLLGDEKEQAEVRKNTKLRLLLRQDIRRVAADAAKP